MRKPSKFRSTPHPGMPPTPVKGVIVVNPAERLSVKRHLRRVADKLPVIPPPEGR